MFSSGLYAKVRSLLLSRRRLLFTCATYRHRTQPFGFVETEISPVSSQAHTIISRQMRIQSSQKRRGKFASHAWDQISPDFSSVYESGFKNWISCYYVSQVALGAVSYWFLGIELPKLMEIIPEDSIQMIIASYSVIVSLYLSANFWIRRVYFRIYYNAHSGQFVAVRRTCFGRLKKLYYTPADIVITSKQHLEAGVAVKIKGQRCYLASDNFVSSMYYNMHFQDQGLTESYVRGPKF